MQRPSSRQSQARPSSAAGNRINNINNAQTRSMIPNARSSMLPTASQASSNARTNGDMYGNNDYANEGLSPSQQRTKDKQAELEGFTRVMMQTEQLNAQIAELGEKTDLLKDGGKAIAQVVANWQNVFRATHIALAGMASRQARGEEDAQMPTLVRVPISSSALDDHETPET